MGSIRDARREGAQHAAPATATNNTAETPNAMGSVGLTA